MDLSNCRITLRANCGVICPYCNKKKDINPEVRLGSAEFCKYSRKMDRKSSKIVEMEFSNKFLSQFRELKKIYAENQLKLRKNAKNATSSWLPESIHPNFLAKYSPGLYSGTIGRTFCLVHFTKQIHYPKYSRSAGITLKTSCFFWIQHNTEKI